VTDFWLPYIMRIQALKEYRSWRIRAFVATQGRAWAERLIEKVPGASVRKGQLSIEGRALEAFLRDRAPEVAAALAKVLDCSPGQGRPWTPGLIERQDLAVLELAKAWAGRWEAPGREEPRS
jgi:hypothetical protein